MNKTNLAKLKLLNKYWGNSMTFLKHYKMYRLLLLLPLLCACSPSSDNNKPSESDGCVFRTPFQCYDCNAPEYIMVGTKEECTSRCPNREVNYNGSGTGNNYVVNCVLKECPADKPLRGYYGGCYSCDDPLEKDFWQVSNCEVCSNRYVDEHDRCQFKDGRQLSRGDDLEFYPERKCPADKPLHQRNNECFPCDVQKVVLIDSEYNWGKKAELDAVCPDRIIIGDVGGNPPSYPPCPKNYPIMDYNGYCYSCDEQFPIDLRFNEDYCGRFCSGKRYVPQYSSQCILCPQDKSALRKEECRACGGKFINKKCQ